MLQYCIILVIFFVDVKSQSQCSTPRATDGVCIPINACPDLLDLVKKTTKSQQDVNFLRQSHCGFQDRSPLVCCEVKKSYSMSCTTSNGLSGNCMAQNTCPQFDDKTLTRCNGPANEFYVCCPQRIGPVQPVSSKQCRMSALPPDPRTECCGRDAFLGNRIVGGNATSLDQYPWLALIEYKKGQTISTLCGGVLISGQYVLTAAHCLVGRVISNGNIPTSVRLGEYDTSTDLDCIKVEGGGLDCADRPIKIKIAKRIVHPKFVADSIGGDDIALLKLQSTAPYTDFIRPICLPINDISQKRLSDYKLLASGWGVTETTRSSNLKLHVDLPMVERNKCQQDYAKKRTRLNVTPGQICAGGIVGKDTCKGDSGGPLMYENGRIFEVTGIVSFGPTPCGNGLPGIYTNVRHYISWITSNMQP